MRIKVDPGCFVPERAHRHDAGMDLKTPKRVVLRAHDCAIIDTGVHVEIPIGCVGMLKSKSGLNVKHGIVSEGVIDSGYTGSIVVKLYNHSDDMYIFDEGDKISQLVVIPCVLGEVELVESLEDTERGDGGFGSTGK